MDDLNATSNAPQNQPEESTGHSGAGSIVGTIIIILLLAVGAFYFWGAKLNKIDDSPPPLILGNETTESLPVPSSDVTSGLPPQQTSDDSEAIMADINAMNLDQLDAQTDASLQTYGTVTQ
jgi:hypothetical protein